MKTADIFNFFVYPASMYLDSNITWSAALASINRLVCSNDRTCGDHEIAGGQFE